MKLEKKEEASGVAGFFSAKNITVVFIVFFLSLFSGFVVSCLVPFAAGAGKKAVYINYNSGLRKIARVLYEGKALKNKNVFIIYSLITGNNKKYKAGEYEFSGSDSVVSISSKIARGDMISHEVIFPEGTDIYEMAEILAEKSIVNKEKFISLATDPKFLKTIGLNYASAEGLLFPDTYMFLRGEGEEKIIKTMFDKFREKAGLNPEAGYDIQGKNYKGYSVLKMASIIEKEAQLEAERAVISSVFYNRLRLPEAYERRLESCATVRYALNKKHGIITFKDLQCDSLFNTYKKIGMPPTPITNPGLKSIEAALHPAATTYLFFVVKGDGSHTFTSTFEEHKKAKFHNRQAGGEVN